MINNVSADVTNSINAANSPPGGGGSDDVALFNKEQSQAGGFTGATQQSSDIDALVLGTQGRQGTGADASLQFDGKTQKSSDIDALVQAAATPRNGGITGTAGTQGGQATATSLGIGTAADKVQGQATSTSNTILDAQQTLAQAKPTTAQGYVFNRAAATVGSDLASLATNKSLPATAQQSLADAAQHFNAAVKANTAGNLAGAAKEFVQAEKSFSSVLASTGGKDLSSTNKALSNAVTDFGTAGQVLAQQAGPTTKLAAGTSNQLESQLLPTLQKLQGITPTYAGKAANVVNGLKSTGQDLLGLAERLGSFPDTPPSVKASVAQAIKDYNQLVTDVPNGTTAGVQAQAADVQKLTSDVASIVSAAKAAPKDSNAHNVEVAPNLSTLVSDLSNTTNALAARQTTLGTGKLGSLFNASTSAPSVQATPSVPTPHISQNLSAETSANVA